MGGGRPRGVGPTPHGLTRPEDFHGGRAGRPSSPASVLDVGGGPGVHARWLTDRGYRVLVVDPVERHVRQAREQGLAAAVVGDARHLDHADGSIDAGLTHCRSGHRDDRAARPPGRPRHVPPRAAQGVCLGGVGDPRPGREPSVCSLTPISRQFFFSSSASITRMPLGPRRYVSLYTSS
ncbi:class I SAM-dependent methyltransferase [Streptomyces sp. NPDC055796]